MENLNIILIPTGEPIVDCDTCTVTTPAQVSKIIYNISEIQSFIDDCDGYIYSDLNKEPIATIKRCAYLNKNNSVYLEISLIGDNDLDINDKCYYR